MRYDNQANQIQPDTGKVLGIGTAVSTVAPLSWASSITVDLTKGNKFPVTLGGATTFVNPTITADMIGMEFTLILSQDGSGGRTVSFGSFFKFPDGTAPTASTAAGKRDRVICEIVSSSIIDAVYVKGF